jgi:hypothetical protein
MNPDDGVQEESIDEILSITQEDETKPATPPSVDASTAETYVKMQERQRELEAKLALKEAMLEQAVRQPTQPVQQQPQNTGIRVLTDEEFNQLASENPAAAIKYQQQLNNVLLEEALNKRLAPLSQGVISSAEADARRKYAMEFELFGPEIAKHKAQVPESVFSNPASWDQLIAMVRGAPENINKYIAKVQEKAGVKTPAQQAQEEQQTNNVGFVPTQTNVTTQLPTQSKLSELERSVLRQWGFASEAEYLKFRNSNSDTI